MNNIDDKYNKLLRNLENKRETHKNLYNIWKEILTKQYTKLNNLILQGETAINSMETSKDIDEITIQELLILFS
jgi:hypothetical protein